MCFPPGNEAAELLMRPKSGTFVLYCRLGVCNFFWPNRLDLSEVTQPANLFHQNLRSMARSQNSFLKKQLEQKKAKKKENKEQRKQERQENSAGGKLEDMMAYVDENVNITTTPPEERKKYLAPDITE